MELPKTNFFFQILQGGDVARTGISGVQLVDEDFVRGNDSVEIRTDDEFNLSIFDGFTQFVRTGPRLNDIERVFTDGEVSTEVTFSDGSTLSGVLGLLDQRSGVGGTSQQFLLDQDALSSAGKSLSDIASIDIEAFVDHDLTFAELGFAVDVPDDGSGNDPVPAPEVNLIEGTSEGDRLNGTAQNDELVGGAGDDRLFGEDGDDILNGGADDDRLSGGNGADTFVFGSFANDGDRDRDRILDFDASEDTIVLEAGVTIRRAFERRDDVVIELIGDRDIIRVEDADLSILDQIVFMDDVFVA